jgi:hypothetical protein
MPFCHGASVFVIGFLYTLANILKEDIFADEKCVWRYIAP